MCLLPTHPMKTLGVRVHENTLYSDWNSVVTIAQARLSTPLHSIYFLSMNMECLLVCQFPFFIKAV